jgi:hypothetical protein
MACILMVMREDVVAYCDAFVKRWIEEYEPQMAKYNHDGVAIGIPGGTGPDGTVISARQINLGPKSS